ncbi:GerAB/ArcD/ProY family transporter [Gottfriedia luciferensis]|uniref:GerAB/ArcD/ProY family transporter n=1 Tax=Gottfriedia luciferensis TaxID=178774 RepID=UPI000B43CF3C|nr:GerAB/ArcD/ProY family transporter [Gottfriedia luciferensis]
MNASRINSFQLFSLIVIFELGSALLIEVGKESGKNNWIVLLLGTGIGCVLYLIYTSLYQYYPHLIFTSLLQKILGKFIGWPIGVIYCLYFMYLAARVLRDFSFLLITTAYENTSMKLIAFLMIISVMYIAATGLQAFSRLSTLGLIIVSLIIVVFLTLEMLNKLPDSENLLPILGDGWKPILQTLFPTVITIPFGEMITFNMLLPFLSKSNQARKIGLSAILISGFYLSFSAAWHIAILGEDTVINNTFPILTSVSLINLANFITRLEPFIVMFLVIFGLFKILIFFYCSVIGFADLLKIKNPNRLIIPIGLITYVLSKYIASNSVEHLYIGLKLVPYYIHIPLQIILPFILLITSFVRNKITYG